MEERSKYVAPRPKARPTLPAKEQAVAEQTFLQVEKSPAGQDFVVSDECDIKFTEENEEQAVNQEQEFHQSEEVIAGMEETSASVRIAHSANVLTASTEEKLIDDAHWVTEHECDDFDAAGSEAERTVMTQQDVEEKEEGE